jgi:HKD family nuclease
MGSNGAIRVRWYRTHGEQFHTKLVLVRSPERFWFTVGSANLTRRNLRDLNLEANLAVESEADSPLARQVLGYFEMLWNNHAPLGVEYTADFEVYADPSQTRYWSYRISEALGLGTF